MSQSPATSLGSFRVALHDVAVAPLALERFGEVLDDPAYADLMELGQRARAALAGRVVWCVNSTARGGGVAEMLQSLLAYTRGAGVDTRWVVADGTPAFFELTKRIHNCLHGAAGVAPPVASDRATYEQITGAAAEQLVRRVAPGDVVILHDPQTAGLAPALGAHGIGTAWRCHVGIDEPTEAVRETWAFLAPYVQATDAYVFSREQFLWDGLDHDRAIVIPPSIDVFSAKNQTLAPGAAEAILATAGLLEDGTRHEAVFRRRDGTPGRVDRHAQLWQDERISHGAPFVAQVSRWDRLKDPLGVLQAFSSIADAVPDAHLVLAGPATAAVSDDPEGAEVLDEVTAAWEVLPTAARRRVHLAALPMDDPEENAAIVNALQSIATVVVQKSLAEGFGLTVAEAMWKARPVVAGAVGGIQDQLVDGESGLLVDPRDLTACGEALVRLLRDAALAQRLGEAARVRVREEFLEPRHLRQWFEVVQRIERT